jgi:molybdate transport system permease protein
VLSAKLAALTSVFLLLIGLPVSYWITYSRWRWKFLIEAIVALPLVLPPTVLGYYVLVATAPNTMVGRIYQSLWEDAAFTFEGLLLASILYSLPFSVQPFSSGFASVPHKLIQASSVLGAGPLRTFFRIILPLSTGSVLTGVVLSFAHTLGEFGVVLMVGGNIPGVTHTVSIDIYDKAQSLDYPSANQTALALLVFSFVVLSFVYWLNKKSLAIRN